MWSESCVGDWCARSLVLETETPTKPGHTSNTFYFGLLGCRAGQS
jgi:hypothetical protein